MIEQIANRRLGEFWHDVTGGKGRRNEVSMNRMSYQGNDSSKWGNPALPVVRLPLCMARADDASEASAAHKKSGPAEICRAAFVDHV